MAPEPRGAGIYSNVEQQMLKLSNISTIQSSLAKVFAKIPHTTSIFVYAQTDEPHPRPLTAVAGVVVVVVVGNDIMLLLI